MTTLEVFENRPADFCPEVEISICHVEVNGRFLLLKRCPNEKEGGTWGVPGGKIEVHETPREGAIRELLEETDIDLKLHDLEEVGKLYVRRHMAYVCHLFRVWLEKLPTINLSDEHTDYRWVTAAEAETMPLVSGAKDTFALYYRMITSKRPL